MAGNSAIPSGWNWAISSPETAGFNGDTEAEGVIFIFCVSSSSTSRDEAVDWDSLRAGF